MTADVVVAGQLARDLVLVVDDVPEAGQSRRVRERREMLGGKGANQAVAVAQLGLRPALIAVAGDDEAGSRLLEQARRDGIDVWPVGEIIELDINVTSRTGDFACASLITEILAPPPLERIWLVNNLPDWQPDHEHERELQAVRTATAVEDLLARKPGHLIVAGDFDADPAAASIRFWTGRQSLNGHSVCYRDAWESGRPGEPGHTFVPGNPNSADWDWPYRRIDYILIRCAQHGGPTLTVSNCCPEHSRLLGFEPLSVVR